MPNENEVVEVVCALIEKKGKVMCCQRSLRMPHSLKWEFPGGKVEPLEDHLSALQREIKEELNLELLDLIFFDSSEVTIGSKNVRLHAYSCRSTNLEEMLLHEHERVKWMDKNEILNLDWLDADLPLVKNWIREKQNS